MPSAPSSRPTALALALLAAHALVVGTLASCRSRDFDLESREIPVHVWISVPDAPARETTFPALVYVGSEKALEGPLRFPPGIAHVQVPTVYVPAGRHVVSAVVRGGAGSATRRITVGEESWVQVLVRGNDVEIRHSNEQPSVWPR